MPDPLHITIERSGNNFRLDWTGSEPPFKLQECASLTSPIAWSNVGNPTLARNKTVPNDAASKFFRVQGEVPLLEVYALNPTVLRWSVPDLE